MIAVLLSAMMAGQSEDLVYGMTAEAAAQMTPKTWMAHVERTKGAALSEQEMNGAIQYFSMCVQAHTDGLLASQSATKRAEFAALRKAFEEMLWAIYVTEDTLSGGGTMYLGFHLFRDADFRVLVRDMVANRLADPGAQRVSDGTAAFDALIHRIAKMELDVPEPERAKGLSSARKARAAYLRLAGSLKNRTRGHSNAVISRCIRIADLALRN